MRGCATRVNSSYNKRTKGTRSTPQLALGLVRGHPLLSLTIIYQLNYTMVSSDAPSLTLLARTYHGRARRQV